MCGLDETLDSNRMLFGSQRCVLCDGGVGVCVCAEQWDGNDNSDGDGRSKGRGNGMVPRFLDRDGSGHRGHGGDAMSHGSDGQPENQGGVSQGNEGDDAEVPRTSSQLNPYHRNPDPKRHAEDRRRRSAIRTPCFSCRERQLGYVRLPERKVEGHELSCPHRRRIFIRHVVRDCVGLKQGGARVPGKWVSETRDLADCRKSGVGHIELIET
jgi:hypothetical protein